MPRHYRAFISVPIDVASDGDAQAAADALAASVAGGHGQVEVVGETAEDSLRIARVIYADPHFANQLPFDWKS
jgi:hypothetical protein